MEEQSPSSFRWELSEGKFLLWKFLFSPSQSLQFKCLGQKAEQEDRCNYIKKKTIVFRKHCSCNLHSKGSKANTLNSLPRKARVLQLIELTNTDVKDHVLKELVKYVQLLMERLKFF